MMDLFVERVDVWAAPIEDKPGGLADVLSILRDAGVDLQFIIARRAWNEPGKGVIFVTPLQGDGEIAAAAQVKRSDRAWGRKPAPCCLSGGRRRLRVWTVKPI